MSTGHSPLWGNWAHPQTHNTSNPHPRPAWQQAGTSHSDTSTPRPDTWTPRPDTRHERNVSGYEFIRLFVYSPKLLTAELIPPQNLLNSDMLPSTGSGTGITVPEVEPVETSDIPVVEPVETQILNIFVEIIQDEQKRSNYFYRR